MKYVVNVSPITNSLGDENWFLGTGFFGEEFSSIEELKQIVCKHVCTSKEFPHRVMHSFKLTFHLASTVSSMKAEGNRQCKENGMVELFSIAAKLRADPYFGKEVYFLTGGRYESDPSKVFNYVMYNASTKQWTPIYGKMLEVLKTLGIVL